MTESGVMVEADDANHRAAADRACDLGDTFRAESAAQFNRYATFVDQINRRRAGARVVGDSHGNNFDFGCADGGDVLAGISLRGDEHEGGSTTHDV